MAKCEHCEREMLTATGCKFDLFVRKDGTKIKRIKYGDPNDLMFFGNERCHDCGAMIGYPHHLGCDSERCPQCNQQYLMCDCEFEYLEDSTPLNVTNI